MTIPMPDRPIHGRFDTMAAFNFATKTWLRFMALEKSNGNGSPVGGSSGGSTVIVQTPSGNAAFTPGLLARNHTTDALAPGYIYGRNPATGKWERAYCVTDTADRADMILPEFCVANIVAPGAEFEPIISGVLLLKLQGGQSTPQWPVMSNNAARAWLTTSTSEPGTVYIGTKPTSPINVPIGRIVGPAEGDMIRVLVRHWEVE